MPTYQYECEPCKFAFETYQSIKDSPLVMCPECNKETLQKVISGGSGYFVKDSGVMPGPSPKKEETKKKTEESDHRHHDHHHGCSHGHHFPGCGHDHSISK